MKYESHNKHKDPASLVEKISTRIVHSFVNGIIAFSIFSVLVCLVVFSVKYSEVFSFKELVWLLPAGAIVFGIFKLSKYLAVKSEKLLIITMVAIGVCSALLMNFAYNTKPCSDYSMIWNAAIKMANGSFAESLPSADYMYHYNWQIGIAFFESIVVRYLGLFDYQFEMTYNHNVEMYTQYPVKALYSISWFQYALLLILAFFGLREYMKKYNVDGYLIFFIGNTLVYFFVEAWSSYRFESYPFLIIFAALGMKKVAQKYKSKNINK